MLTARPAGNDRVCVTVTEEVDGVARSGDFLFSETGVTIALHAGVFEEGVVAAMLRKAEIAVKAWRVINEASR